MRRVASELAILLGLLLLLWVVRQLPVEDAAGVSDAVVTPGLVAMTFGFALLAAHLLGRVLLSAGLPGITGYLLAGVLLGPFVFGLISVEVKDQLRVINQIALGLIALNAGGELAIKTLRPRLRAVGWITLLHAFLLFAGCTLAIHLFGRSQLGSRSSLFEGLGASHLLALALIVGLVATANSPSSTVAVINEVRASGPMTTVSLGVTVLKDVVVLVMMAVTLQIVSDLAGGGADISGSSGSLVGISLEIVTSLLLGVGLGGVVILYLARVGKESALFLLGVVFGVIELSRVLDEGLHFHVHFLLVCMAAGFVVENASQRGRDLVHGLERSSLPVYAVFFTLSGVGLDLAAVVQIWPIALGFVLWRGVLLYVATWTGAWLAGESKPVKRLAWSSFLAQAGISLGLAELVAVRYPLIGERAKTLILAVIALNQIAGPILFRLALRRSGEAQLE